MTKLLKEKEYAHGAQIIQQGGTVAFRTETVYGLGADATNADAVAKIYQAKNRPSANPVILHFHSLKHLLEYFDKIDSVSLAILKKFKKAMTVTLDLPAESRLAKNILGDAECVAVRIPGCSFTRKFIKSCGVPVAAPSANLSGRPSGTRWQDVYDDLNGKIDAILMGRDTKIGVESTVVDVVYDAGGNATLNILRPGGTGIERLRKLGHHINTETDSENLKNSPGTRFKHYSPMYPVYIATNGGPDIERADRILEFTTGKNAVVLCKTKNKDLYDGESVITLGNKASEVCAALFSSLREAEKKITARKNGEPEVIVIEEMPHTLEYAAVRERIQKASEGRVI